MSGVAEAGLVLGLISSVITTFEAAQEIYDAASDTKGLPKKFRAAAEQIPLVYNALEIAERNIRAQNVNEKALQSAIPVLNRCKESATRIKDIFDKTIPANDASRAERLRKAVGLKMKSNKLKEDMEEVAKNMELLAQYQVFQDAEALKDIQEAINNLGNLPDEEDTSQFVHSGTGAINANTGTGHQQNYSYINSGSGRQYNADKQFFGRDQVETQINHHYNFHEDSSGQSRTEFTGSYAHSSLQPISSYISRPELEQRLQAQLPAIKTSSTQTRTVVVWGLGGAGKSQLALNYIQHHKHQYQAIFWIEAGQPNTIERDYVQIYRQLYPRQNVTNTAISPEDAVTSVKSWLQRRDKRCLWVMDSADEVEDETSESYVDLHYYLPDAAQLDRIITTRNSRLQYSNQQEAISVAEMSADEAIQLFRKCARIQQTSDGDRSKIEMIVTELGYLALAVTLAGSYVSETPRVRSDLSLYLKEYRSNRRRLLSRKARHHVHRYQDSLLSTWELSFTAVERQDRVAARLLTLLSVINFDDIFLDLLSLSKLSQASQSSNSEAVNIMQWVRLLSSGQTQIDEYTIEASFAVLQAYSLVSQGKGRTYAMHKLVHAWGYDRLQMEEQWKWSSAGLELLSWVVQDQGYDKDLIAAARIVPHIMANFVGVSMVYNAEDSTVENVRGHIIKLARLLVDLGRWDDVYKVYLFQKQTTEKRLGLGHPDTLTDTENVATVLSQLGKYKSAEDMHRQILNLRKQVLGPEHPDTLLTMNSLGQTLARQGHYKQAERLLRETFKIRKAVLGTKHPDTLTSMDNLALVLNTQGKYEEAEQMHQGTLKLRTTILGPEHRDTLTSMENLAVALSGQSKYKESEQFFREVFELRKAVQGQDHPDALKSMNNVAALLARQGKYQQAEQMHQEVVELRTAISGPESLETLTSIANLGTALAWQGKYEQAEQIFRKTLKSRQTVLGREHPETLTNMNNLAEALRWQGKLQEAEQIHRETLNSRKAVLGSKHPDIKKSINGLAYVLTLQGKHEEAAAVRMSAVTIETKK